MDSLPNADVLMIRPSLSQDLGHQNQIPLATTMSFPALHSTSSHITFSKARLAATNHKKDSIPEVVTGITPCIARFFRRMVLDHEHAVKDLDRWITDAVAHYVSPQVALIHVKVEEGEIWDAAHSRTTEARVPSQISFKHTIVRCLGPDEVKVARDELTKVMRAMVREIEVSEREREDLEELLTDEQVLAKVLHSNLADSPPVFGGRSKSPTAVHNPVLYHPKQISPTTAMPPPTSHSTAGSIASSNAPPTAIDHRNDAIAEVFVCVWDCIARLVRRIVPEYAHAAEHVDKWTRGAVVDFVWPEVERILVELTRAGIQWVVLNMQTSPRLLASEIEEKISCALETADDRLSKIWEEMKKLKEKLLDLERRKTVIKHAWADERKITESMIQAEGSLLSRSTT
jgi:hypothetical protein